MQTFLPYPNFLQSARCLDYRRLGKQRVECKQILRVLLGESGGWKNHPAVKMWEGHAGSLAEYGATVCSEWVARGFKDSLMQFFTDNMFGVDRVKPAWFGNEEFHASHRSNLLRKDLLYYSQLGWLEPPDLPYIWPTKDIKI